MPIDSIEQWEQTQAELAIRRWLYSIGLWAPGAERFGAPQEQDVFPAALDQEQIDQVLRSEVVGRIGCYADSEGDRALAAQQRPVVFRIILTERTGRYDKRP